jgi:histone H3/H4
MSGEEGHHRLKRTPIFKAQLLPAGGPKRKPGKLVESESAWLRSVGGVDVPRAPARRIAQRVIGDTVPIIQGENRRFARRLTLRGKRVPASLTVAPAHHWSISEEALDHITALIDITAKDLAKASHKIADADRRKTILASDVRLAKSLKAE